MREAERQTTIPETRSVWSTSIRFAIVVIFGVVIWFMPQPEGVSSQAWHLFALFVATINLGKKRVAADESDTPATDPPT